MLKRIKISVIVKGENDVESKSKKDVAAGLIMCDGLLLIAQRKHGKSLE